MLMVITAAGCCELCLAKVSLKSHVKSPGSSSGVEQFALFHLFLFFCYELRDNVSLVCFNGDSLGCLQVLQV